MNTPTDVNQWATLASGGLSNFEGGITIQATVDFGSSADFYERIVDLGSAANTDAIIFGRELTDRTLYFEVVRGLNGGQGRCRAENAISATAEMANFAVTLGGVGATPTCKIYKNGTDLGVLGTFQRTSLGVLVSLGAAIGLQTPISAEFCVL
jgi:hypothetical protein